MPGATGGKIELALATSGSAGWKTVRGRWESDLADYAPSLHHIEHHWRLFASITERFGPKSLGHAIAGRAAARAAIAAGAKVVLLSTLQNAPWAPLHKGIQYIVYGDCTSAQLSQNYGGKKLEPPGSWICARIRRLRDHGCTFLCMSHWYRDALRNEYDIPESQLLFLPFYVDTNKWKPLARKPARARKQVLFIGAHLERKGADIVYAARAAAALRIRGFSYRLPQRRGGSGKSPSPSRSRRRIRRSHPPDRRMRSVSAADARRHVLDRGAGGGRLRAAGDHHGARRDWRNRPRWRHGNGVARTGSRLLRKRVGDLPRKSPPGRRARPQRARARRAPLFQDKAHGNLARRHCARRRDSRANLERRPARHRIERG